MRKSPAKRSRRLPLWCAALAMLLLSVACAIEENDEIPVDREDSREGTSSIFSRPSTVLPGRWVERTLEWLR